MDFSARILSKIMLCSFSKLSVYFCIDDRRLLYSQDDYKVLMSDASCIPPISEIPRMYNRAKEFYYDSSLNMRYAFWVGHLTLLSSSNSIYIFQICNHWCFISAFIGQINSLLN